MTAQYSSDFCHAHAAARWLTCCRCCLAVQVFVGGMPYGYSREQVAEYWGWCGEIEALDCMTFPDTGRFRFVLTLCDCMSHACIMCLGSGECTARVDCMTFPDSGRFRCVKEMVAYAYEACRQGSNVVCGGWGWGGGSK